MRGEDREKEVFKLIYVAIFKNVSYLFIIFIWLKLLGSDMELTKKEKG